MSDSKSRRELLKSSAGLSIFSLLPASAIAGFPTKVIELNQGGTNPVVKVPSEIDARPGSSLRVTIIPSSIDTSGDSYEVRVFEMTVGKDADSKIVVQAKHQGIYGIDQREYSTTVNVKDSETPIIATIKLDYLPDAAPGKMIVVAAFNGSRSGLATVFLRKV